MRSLLLRLNDFVYPHTYQIAWCSTLCWFGLTLDGVMPIIISSALKTVLFVLACLLTIIFVTPELYMLSLRRKRINCLLNTEEAVYG